MWSNIVSDIVGAFVALLVGAIGVYGGIYIKMLETKLKRKMLLDEINRYIAWAEESKSFKTMSVSEKIESVFIKANEFAEENGINVSDKELNIMVEKAIESKSRLEKIGLGLIKKRSIENKEGDK